MFHVEHYNYFLIVSHSFTPHYQYFTLNIPQFIFTTKLFPVKLATRILTGIIININPTQPHDHDIKCKYNSSINILRFDMRLIFTTHRHNRQPTDKTIYYSITIYYIFPKLPILANNSPHKVYYVEIFKENEQYRGRVYKLRNNGIA